MLSPPLLSYWHNKKPILFNSLAPGIGDSDSKSVISQHMLWIKFTSTSTCEIALRWLQQNPFDDKSTLVQILTWCHQATSHYLINVNIDLCRHVASLGHNEFTYCHLVTPNHVGGIADLGQHWIRYGLLPGSIKPNYPSRIQIIWSKVDL